MLEERWHEDRIDPEVFLELQDLATVLSRVPDLQFQFTYGSFIDIEARRISVGSMWETTEQIIQNAGYKTDLYLRAVGTMHYSDVSALMSFQQANTSKFAQQLVTLLEDLRLEEMIKRKRPGTVREFTIRREYLRNFFMSQLKTNIVRALPSDTLFTMVYLTLSAQGPEVNFPETTNREKEHLETIKPLLFEGFEALTTIDIVGIVNQIMSVIGTNFKDMSNIYFNFPISSAPENLGLRSLFDQLTRTDDVENEDSAVMSQDNADYTDETLSTWHQEQKPSEQQQTFLQMDLELGTKSNLRGESTRETESGDQAFASAQGSSQKSSKQDYTSLSALEIHENDGSSKRRSAPYGQMNIHAVPIVKRAQNPSKDERTAYTNIQMEIEPHKRKLTATLAKILDYKREMSRENLHFGRLSKNILPVVTDEFPRLFYKKDDDSKAFDAVFTLMVDCSASMNQKMPETKRGIALFHEVLKELRIPHSIVGFWEGATSSLQKEQPNYFHLIHSFTDSPHDNNGAKIMQLTPEEDNRDGYSIRKMTEELMIRREKHKFLLVFSDGEPAAENYYETGIVDTNVAVSHAWKQGINVLGMFLSNDKINDRERKVMRSIYGRDQLLIESLTELPERLIPLLKRLLTRTI